MPSPHSPWKELEKWEQTLRRNYRVVYDANDFVAGVLFTLGSILFFGFDENLAKWCFLIGSILFVIRPFINLVRDIQITAKKREGTAERIYGHQTR